MDAAKGETLPLRSAEEVVLVRQATRRRSVDLGFSIIEQTKIVTAASELARNTVIHGGGGSVLIEEVTNGIRKGIRLTFEDRGPGIPQAEREKIFQRFYQTDPSRSKAKPGTGLGLAIVKHLAALHHARVVVGGEPGGGAVFRVSFPPPSRITARPV